MIAFGFGIVVKTMSKHVLEVWQKIPQIISLLFVPTMQEHFPALPVFLPLPVSDLISAVFFIQVPPPMFDVNESASPTSFVLLPLARVRGKRLF